MGPLATARQTSFSLEDRYRAEQGTVYLTGIQALVRVLLDRARVDRGAGRETATYVSGYEGSPLGGYDLELARRSALLRELSIVHQPGLNEELAATAVSGTQTARSVGALSHAGVTGIWYGKAPGLDRASDAFRHANLIGTDPAGGAVAFVGDDPSAKSSTVPCSSELALADLAMPTFFPADAGEILDHGLHAVELSRASGLWSALKVATMVADGATTTPVAADWRAPDLTDLGGGLAPYTHRPTAHLLGTAQAELERSFHQNRLPIVGEYVRRAGLNRITGTREARVGIVSTGSTYLSLRQALRAVGLDEAGLERAGIRLLKLGVVFPLEPSIVREFAAGLKTVLVVEEKRAFLEDAVKVALYGLPSAPPVYGKRGPDGSSLMSPLGELDADAIAGGLHRFLTSVGVAGVVAPPSARQQISLPMAPRTPFFCSGCPHNSSTEVAPGTVVGAGIGCHALLLLMPGERSGNIVGVTQMGGEGTQWLGMAPFVGRRHFVQNIGDGTFAHSGSLAVRAAVAAGVNVTYKLLRNSAVAMTGGQQPVGELSLPQVVALLRAEGVRRVVVTTDEPERVRRQLGRAADVRHRDELLSVQEELAAVEGVTVLIHDQECAAEKRRKRKRGKSATPTSRVLINERVCEGCGDCGVTSNCLSVRPVQTPFGRKTQINQSSCNLDFSCLDGDCPSFLTVVPGERAEFSIGEVTAPAEPARIVPAGDFTMRITGIGGTGIVTVSQILATAAAIEGRSVRAMDQIGLAQKGGAVVSDLILSADRSERSPRVGVGECDLYLGCDALVAASPANLRMTSVLRTVAVVSTSEVATGEMVVDTTASYPGRDRLVATVEANVRDAHFLDAAALAIRHLGNEQYANLIVLGAAYQAGALPLGSAAIEQAIELNGTAVAANIAAFRHGRLAVAGIDPAEPASVVASLDDLVRERAADLTAYQNATYARRYTDVVTRVQAADGDGALAVAVARNLYKLMAYKDEYEVARLSLDPKLTAAIADAFGAGATYRYRLHPPVLRSLGMRNKLSLGPWFRWVFRALVALRGLRGTAFDPFGRAEVRRVERALVEEYCAIVDKLLHGLTADNHSLAVEIAELPDLVRGYEDVKLRNVAAYRERVTELLDRFAAHPLAQHQPSVAVHAADAHDLQAVSNTGPAQ